MKGSARENGRCLLTGATGFLGSHIMAGLLSRGRGVVVLGRPSKGESLQERIAKLLRWFGCEDRAELLELHETDFLETRLGLGGDVYDDLCDRGLDIIHCASDTSFAERNRKRVMKSNVESLTGMLDFAIESRIRGFYYISTAYAAGTGQRECHEAPVTSARFTNVYEESKAQAEGIIARRCREGEIPCTIIRPSVVYGDSVTGRSLRFNALYYPVRSLQHIRDIYLDDIARHGGKKSAECGIHINGDGELYLPLRIFVPHEGTINLIPVDYFTDAVLAILDTPAPDTYYHVTSRNPETLANLVSYIERFLNVTGLEVVIGSSGADEMKNPPEELFDHFVRLYRPYMSDRRIFTREHTDDATGGALPPDLSYDIFRRCMAFAVAANWGQA